MTEKLKNAKLSESEKIEKIVEEYSHKIQNLEIELSKLEEINSQLRQGKETLMREKDQIYSKIQNENSLKIELNETKNRLEEEKKLRRRDSINYDNLHNNLKIEFEQENQALRETVLKLNKNLELQRVDEVKNDHNKNIIEDLRFKIRALINENEKLKMESTYKDSKMNVRY